MILSLPIRNFTRAASLAGGGLSKQACQQRVSHCSGVNHVRTERSRRGQRQRIGKRTGWLFFPHRGTVPIVQSRLLRFLPPAKSKGTVHQHPMKANRPVTAHHEVSPAKLIFHLLVALLNPVPQAIQTHPFSQRSRLERQVGRQKPGRRLR